MSGRTIRLAGAYYGVEGIPEGWLEKVAERSLIETLADRLLALNQAGAGQ